jgi:hypothetical protein
MFLLPVRVTTVSKPAAIKAGEINFNNVFMLEQVALSCAREVRVSDCCQEKNYRVSHSSLLFARLRHLLPTRQNPVHLFKICSRVLMGRWPDDKRSTLTTFALIFLLFPLLCALAWWFVRG